MTAIEILHQNLVVCIRGVARRFASDCDGAVAVEYIVTGAIIAVGVAAGVSVLSGAVTDLYQNVIDKFGS